MKQGWSVTIEGRPSRPVDPEDVVDKLAKIHTAASFGDGLLTTTSTVDARSFSEAIDYVYEALSGAIDGRLEVERTEAVTEARQEKEIEASNVPDLVGLADIAAMLSTTRQRVFQMTANKGFPEAVLELKAGRLWSRPAIVSYLERRAAARPEYRTHPPAPRFP